MSAALFFVAATVNFVAAGYALGSQAAEGSVDESARLWFIASYFAVSATTFWVARKLTKGAGSE